LLPELGKARMIRYERILSRYILHALRAVAEILTPLVDTWPTMYKIMYYTKFDFAYLYSLSSKIVSRGSTK